MILECYSVYDRAAMQYGHPVYMVNDSAAMRSFIDAFDNPNGLLARHPDDFELRHIASFNDETGHFKPLEISRTIMTGGEVMRMRLSHSESLSEDEQKVGGTE